MLLTLMSYLNIKLHIYISLEKLLFYICFYNKWKQHGIFQSYQFRILLNIILNTEIKRCLRKEVLSIYFILL